MERQSKVFSARLLDRRGRRLDEIVVPSLQIARKIERTKEAGAEQGSAGTPGAKSDTSNTTAIVEGKSAKVDVPTESPPSVVEAPVEPEQMSTVLRPWEQSLTLIRKGMSLLPVDHLINFFATTPQVSSKRDIVSIAMHIAIRNDLRTALEQVPWHVLTEQQVGFLSTLTEYWAGIHDGPPPNLDMQELKESQWFQQAFASLKDVANMANLMYYCGGF